MSKFSKLNLQTSDDARKIAKKRLPKMAFDYFDGAALTEYGEFLGRQAIKEIRLAPKVLARGANREINHTILGHKTDIPFGIAPMGMCNLSHPSADKIIAKAGAYFNTPVCFSTMASTAMEDTIKLTDGNGWFQLYVYDDLKAGFNMAERASKAGYETLILTVDVPDLGRRPRELRQNFKVPWWPSISQFIDCAIHPSWSISMLMSGGSPAPANFKNLPPFRRDRPRAGADWDFLKKLRDSWKGNLIVKGVLDPKDAKKIKELGIDAIYVSGHGARQLDSLPAPIIQLPKIRKAVGKNYPLLFDTGVRNGEDVVKAYASGADFVMLGRPILYALGADGERGLKTIINYISKEIQVTLAQIGLAKISEVNPTNLIT
ncbi:MAG: alpha-hydroxy acid oxidase [Paracoccaceae bacterium]|nr:alpha-hydroxy acid oxidase [Paracoccaceae bacterium]